MTTLNDTFKREHAQKDEGYESGSESLSIPTPLRRTPCIYHISMIENLSFDPTTPLTTTKNTQNTHPKDSEATVLYTAIWCLPVLMKRACKNQ